MAVFQIQISETQRDLLIDGLLRKLNEMPLKQSSAPCYTMMMGRTGIQSTVGEECRALHDMLSRIEPNCMNDFTL